MAKQLPDKIFKLTLKYTPRIAVNILLKNKTGEILLTKRGIPPKKHFWHYPGTSLYKNEKLADCLKRLASYELGIEINPKKAKFLGIFENLTGDPRGHFIDVVYEYKINPVPNLKPLHDTEDLKFFKKLPEKIGFDHDKVLNQLGYK